jgi:uncharacterized protein
MPGSNKAAVMNKTGRNNVEMVQSVYAALARHDDKTVVANVTSDVDWRVNGRPGACPIIGEWKTPRGLVEFLQLLGQSVDFLEITPRGYYARWDKIFVLGSSRFTIRENNRRVEIDWAHVFTIRDGKISAFFEYTDTASLVEAYRA